MHFDVAIIGGGIVGAATADYLAKHSLSVLLLEAEDDVASGASKANSGIVHAGYDCEPNTLKARFNREGNSMYHYMTKELDVPFVPCGSLVVAAADGLDGLKKLKERGDLNGIETELIDRAHTLELEPNIADEVQYALYAPTAAVVSPYKMTIALADRAVTNGATVLTDSRVVDLKKRSDGFCVTTADGREYSADVVINAAGQGASDVNSFVGAEQFEVTYQRGDYFLLDQTERENINMVIFPLPTKLGKGILASPTADGNVIYGPTGIYTERGDRRVTAEGLDTIRAQLARNYKCPNYRKVIRLYSGLRTIVGHDFVIAESKLVNGFIYLAGICSPGLSSAPAIAKYVVDELVSKYKALVLKKDAVIVMPKHKRLRDISADEMSELVKGNPSWGRIVCRCEKVTEAEIVNAIHQPVPATTVDAVKRRVRAGMGRCQGGFCEPRVMDILSRELGVPVTSIKKGGTDSYVAIGLIKGEDE